MALNQWSRFLLAQARRATLCWCRQTAWSRTTRGSAACVILPSDLTLKSEAHLCSCDRPGPCGSDVARRNGKGPMMTSILVPLDGSACAERVVPYVRMLAPLLGAHVTLLQALDTDTPEALTAMVDQAAGYADGQMAAERPLPATHAAQPYLPDETRDRARSYLASQAAQLRTAGIQVTTRT